MRKKVCGSAAAGFLGAVLLASPVLAAELLDVKPVVSGSTVVVEVTADIPMTYTYYKVPGQARAVVDIADADPEKVEPLIVVNKGAVASISVDKAMIGDMMVSRLVFNLVSETDISVVQAPDRKTLNVSFGGGKPVAVAPALAPSAPVAAAVAAPVAREPEVTAAAVPAAPVAKEPAADAAVPEPASAEEEDPLGLDEPPPAAVPVKVAAPAAVVRSTKLEPVVPVTAAQVSPSMVVVKGIIVGASFIEVQTSAPVASFKQLRLAKPQRLSIEIPGTSSVGVKLIQVKRFGVSTVRIGTTPGFVRIVLDTTKSAFPGYEIVTTENGVRVNFK